VGPRVQGFLGGRCDPICKRPDSASAKPGKWLHDSQTVIESLKRLAMVLGMRLSGRSRFNGDRRARYTRNSKEQRDDWTSVGLSCGGFCSPPR
jgi:hypothetical protein